MSLNPWRVFILGWKSSKPSMKIPKLWKWWRWTHITSCGEMFIKNVIKIGFERISFWFLGSLNVVYEQPSWLNVDLTFIKSIFTSKSEGDHLQFKSVLDAPSNNILTNKQTQRDCWEIWVDSAKWAGYATTIICFNCDKYSGIYFGTIASWLLAT